MIASSPLLSRHRSVRICCARTTAAAKGAQDGAAVLGTLLPPLALIRRLIQSTLGDLLPRMHGLDSFAVPGKEQHATILAECAQGTAFTSQLPKVL